VVLISNLMNTQYSLITVLIYSLFLAFLIPYLFFILCSFYYSLVLID